MKKLIDAEIINNVCVADDIYRLTVRAAIEGKPGQFIQVRLPSDEFTLRRPFGIASINADQLTMFYRVVGHGTNYLASLQSGKVINLLGALGNGFNLTEGKVLLVGGGLGLAPLIFAASESKADVLIGGKNAAEANLWQSEFESLVDELFIATDDGSAGFHGFVTELLPEVLSKNKYKTILTCGPEIMMRRVAAFAKDSGISCQVSLEKRMGCGLGACLSCSIDTINGRQKICKDGPVFNADDVFYAQS